MTKVKLIIKKFVTGKGTPSNKAFLEGAEQSQEKIAKNEIQDGFRKIIDTPTFDAYLRPSDKTILLTSRGTAITNIKDLSADAQLIANRLSKTKRYNIDKAILQSIVSKQNPAEQDYHISGHSLGGAIMRQLMRDFPFIKSGVGQNGAFQSQDLIQQNPKIKDNQVSTDFLYNLGGRFFRNKQVIPPKDDKIKSFFSRFIPKPLKGHSLSNFKGLQGSGLKDQTDPERFLTALRNAIRFALSGRVRGINPEEREQLQRVEAIIEQGEGGAGEIGQEEIIMELMPLLSQPLEPLLDLIDRHIETGDISPPQIRDGRMGQRVVVAQPRRPESDALPEPQMQRAVPPSLSAPAEVEEAPMTLFYPQSVRTGRPKAFIGKPLTFTQVEQLKTKPEQSQIPVAGVISPPPDEEESEEDEERPIRRGRGLTGGGLGDIQSMRQYNRLLKKTIEQLLRSADITGGELNLRTGDIMLDNLALYRFREALEIIEERERDGREELIRDDIEYQLEGDLLNILDRVQEEEIEPQEARREAELEEVGEPDDQTDYTEKMRELVRNFVEERALDPADEQQEALEDAQSTRQKVIKQGEKDYNEVVTKTLLSTSKKIAALERLQDAQESVQSETEEQEYNRLRIIDNLNDQVNAQDYQRNQLLTTKQLPLEKLKDIFDGLKQVSKEVGDGMEELGISNYFQQSFEQILDIIEQPDERALPMRPLSDILEGRETEGEVLLNLEGDPIFDADDRLVRSSLIPEVVEDAGEIIPEVDEEEPQAGRMVSPERIVEGDLEQELEFVRQGEGEEDEEEDEGEEDEEEDEGEVQGGRMRFREPMSKKRMQRRAKINLDAKKLGTNLTAKLVKNLPFIPEPIKEVAGVVEELTGGTMEKIMKLKLKGGGALQDTQVERLKEMRNELMKRDSSGEHRFKIQQRLRMFPKQTKEKIQDLQKKYNDNLKLFQNKVKEQVERKERMSDKEKDKLFKIIQKVQESLLKIDKKISDEWQIGVEYYKRRPERRDEEEEEEEGGKPMEQFEPRKVRRGKGMTKMGNEKIQKKK